MDALSLDRPQAMGHLELLWATVWEQPGPDETGILTGWTTKDIARAAEWDGDAGGFVDALRGAGFLDLTDAVYSIHDYLTWMPNWVKDRIRKRRWREAKEAKKGPLTRRSRDKSRDKTGHVRSGIDVDLDVDLEVTTSPAAPEPTNKERTEKQALRDSLWDAVVAEWKLPVVTKTQQGRVGRLVSEFRGCGAAPAEIAVRRKRIADAWGPEKATPESTAKHWGEFDGSGPSQSRVGRIEAAPGKYDGVMAKARARGAAHSGGHGGDTELAFPTPGQEPSDRSRAADVPDGNPSGP